MMTAEERNAMCLSQVGLTSEQLRLRRSAREHQYIYDPEDMASSMLWATVFLIICSLANANFWAWLLFEPFALLAIFILARNETIHYHEKQNEWDAELNPRAYDELINDVDPDKYVYIHDLAEEAERLQKSIEYEKTRPFNAWTKSDDKCAEFACEIYLKQMAEVDAGRIYKNKWVRKVPDWDSRLKCKSRVDCADMNVYYYQHAKEKN